MGSKSVTAPFICDKAKAFYGDLSEVPQTSHEHFILKTFFYWCIPYNHTYILVCLIHFLHQLWLWQCLLIHKSGTNITICHANLFLKQCPSVQWECTIRSDVTARNAFVAMADVSRIRGGVRRHTNYVTTHRPFRNVTYRQIQRSRAAKNDKQHLPSRCRSGQFIWFRMTLMQFAVPITYLESSFIQIQAFFFLIFAENYVLKRS